MIYYIYIHRKADTNEIFYVGKGKGNRINGLQNRNKYWNSTVNKHGYIAEKIIENLDEELALFAEMEIINIYRKRGIKLVNMTDGGEGTSGHTYVMPESTKKKLSDKAMGRPAFFKAEHFTDEMRKIIVDSNKRRKLTEKAKETFNFKGLHHTEEHKEYMRKKMTNRTFSEETKLKMSLAQKKRWNKDVCFINE